MIKDDRLLSAIHTAAAEFINRESNRRSLVTVTKVIFQDEKNVHIFISVYPEKDLHAVMDFLARQEKEFLSFLKKTVKLHFVPKMRFLPDPDMGHAPLEQA
jgi:ribosome-binding factor A